MQVGEQLVNTMPVIALVIALWSAAPSISGCSMLGTDMHQQVRDASLWTSPRAALLSQRVDLLDPVPARR